MRARFHESIPNTLQEVDSMKWTDSTNTVTLYTGDTGFEAGTKTLIISTHGGLSGSFTKPYPCVIKFATPKGSALCASLLDAINGNVTESEIAIGGKIKSDDYDLAYFEHDPSSRRIESALAGNTDYDVLTLMPNKSSKLSTILTWLNSWKLKYVGILCLFCRVTGNDDDYTFIGRRVKHVLQPNRMQVLSTAIALELKAKGLVH
ncbi:MAG: putative adhesin [bacterium]